MYKNNRIAAVIPAHNEETQIGRVIETMPEFIDQMVIIDDKSNDKTLDIIRQYQEKYNNIELIRHDTNKGVGGAIATGYKYARDNNFDAAVVMAGDGQMAPSDLPAILDPVVDGEVDYSKGNRLFTGEAYQKIPKVRYFGNAFLSLLTKIASGYWHIADSQSGYAAINRKALETINWDQMYQWYGQPNDILVKLNIYNFKVRDVPVEPVYNIGEKSGIKIRKVLFTISWLLIKLFLWRMKEKYIIRDFHPLIFFYGLGAFFYITMILLFVRVFYVWFSDGDIPDINALAAFFAFMSGSLFTLFAMWFDMEANKELK
ncbi:MAG: glycosyltransferase family 2 protein [Desulfobacterales bacterium]|nr:glycosyltransferase family 2 protein [Desulfobacterales bacterium]